MSAPLCMDHHVNFAITQGLRRLGVDVMTAMEDGAARLPDDELLRRSTELGRALFTFDDLLAIAVRWFDEGQDFAGLIYAHELRITIGQAIRDLHLIAECFDADDMRNRTEFIPYD